ncbi:MAG: aldehyde dehydrogenase [Bacteroidetes bacterium]|nr:aldehyde dehydrogenase [Bacteroidota bacterium]
MLKILNFINGNHCEAVNKNFIENSNPSTGLVYSTLPDSDEQDVERAIESAQNAYNSWSNISAESRFKILNRIAELIDEKNEELALAESIDQGMPLWFARTQVTLSAQNFRFFATAAMQYSSTNHSMEGNYVNYNQKSPIGIVACISSWNLPLYIITWKIAPALATGNCVIAKPSEFAPATAFMLSEICYQAGLPNGVLNIINGRGEKAGNIIVSHPKIKAISFTGKLSTGKVISTLAAPLFKKLSLELGGKNPVLIFADCNLEKAVKETVRASFLNQGELCRSGSRILVEEKIYNNFKKAFLTELKYQSLGNPLLNDTKIGAIVSKQHYDKILSYIEIAKAEGGKILFGGEPVFPKGLENGWFISPTVIENLKNESICNREEIFGPVVTLTSFKTEVDALEIANSTDYGLASSVWTENIQTAHRIATNIKTGLVWINCWMYVDTKSPFGGMKNSGNGNSGAWNIMDFFTEQKNVYIKY